MLDAIVDETIRRVGATTGRFHSKRRAKAKECLKQACYAQCSQPE